MIPEYDYKTGDYNYHIINNEYYDTELPPKNECYIAEPVRDSKKNPKINRNDPCPCGSGKKYKNCCI